MSENPPPISEEELRRHLPKRKLGCVPLAILAVAALILLPLIGWFSWTYVARRGLERRIEMLRAKGQPATASELDKMYAAPPAEKDTTFLWLEAGTALDSQLPKRGERLPFTGQAANPPTPPTQWALLPDAELLLAEFAAEMEMIHQAARQGGAARYPVRFEDGFAALLPHVQQMRAVCRMLSLEAYVHAHRQNPSGVAESIRAGLLGAASVANEPIIVSQLVAIACQQMMITRLQELINDVDFSKQDLEAMRAAIGKVDVRVGVRRSLLGEQAMALTLFRDPSQHSQVNGQSPYISLLGRRYEDACMYIDLTQRTIEAVELPWLQALDAMQRIEKDVERMQRSLVSRQRYALTFLARPAHEGFLTAAVRAVAMQRAADAMIAAKLFQIEHDRLPRSWDELAPEFLDETPEDPFAEQPLRFVNGGSHCLIYSVGVNRVDDGGNGSLEDEIPDVVMELRSR